MNGSKTNQENITKPRRSVINPAQKISLMQNVGARLAKRKLLFRKRKCVCDLCLICAMLGILLMITHIELSIFRLSAVTTIYSPTYLKAIITLSTLCLLVFLLWYHTIDIQLFMIDNGMEDWRLAMSLSRILIIGLESIICLLHPFPGSHNLRLVTFMNRNSNSTPLDISIVPIDVLLALPMFLRFFLVCRVLMLHSQLYQDASAQSLGALNRIHFNFSFIFKSLMSLYAEYVLTTMITFLFLWASWAIRACESFQAENRIDFFDSMWIIAITFLTVGYGDMVPQSTCGKSIAVMTGIFGVGCTALVVAVLARKLELSRAEMYVHNFVISVELNKQMKHAAANVMKEGWLVHKYKKLGWKQRALKHERRLLQAIRRIRELKNDQSRVNDNTLSMVEIYRSQMYMQTTVESTQTMVQEIHRKLLNI